MRFCIYDLDREVQNRRIRISLQLWMLYERRYKRRLQLPIPQSWKIHPNEWHLFILMQLKILSILSKILSIYFCNQSCHLLTLVVKNAPGVAEGRWSSYYIPLDDISFVRRTLHYIRRCLTDLTLEQTVSVDAASLRLGLGYEHCVRLRWMLTKSRRATFIGLVQERAGLQPSSVRPDRRDLNRVMELIRKWRNPSRAQIEFEKLLSTWTLERQHLNQFVTACWMYIRKAMNFTRTLSINAWKIMADLKIDCKA